jgi:hypothetical protein
MATRPRPSFALWAFHTLGRARSSMLLRGFERGAKQARRRNLHTLQEIVRRNRDCVFGREHGFADLDVRDPEAFRAAVPLRSYADFRPWIDRMVAGEQGVLSSEPVLNFALSSGTTQALKYVPTTPTQARLQNRFYAALLPAVPNSRIPGADAAARGISLLSASNESRTTPGGTPVGSASATGIRRIRKIIPYLWSSPWPVFTVEHQPSAWYLHALFGLLERDAKFLSAVFAPYLVQWLRTMEARWDELLHDIETGGLSGTLSLNAEQRQALQALRVPDPERAQQLRLAVAEGFRGFVPRAWPWMAYISTIITGSFCVYLPALREWVGTLPIYTSGYSASEVIVGLNLEIEQPERYVLASGCAWFEFLPVGEQPARARDLHELEIGVDYELAITNFAGLYRYRLEDVVRVEGFHHEAPVLSFAYRRGVLLDLVGERITEAQTRQAVLAFVERWVPSATLVDYCFSTRPERMPPHCVLHLELQGLAGESDPAPELLDRCMRDCSASFDRHRETGKLGAPELELVRPGGFEAFARWRLDRSPGVSRNQLKTPRVVAGELLAALTKP